MFDYDHSQLSLHELHKIGIRSTKEVEEVIEGYSFASEEFLVNVQYPVYRFIGFTAQSHAVTIACRLMNDGTLATLDVWIPSVPEIINDFCRYCR